MRELVLAVAGAALLLAYAVQWAGIVGRARPSMGLWAMNTSMGLGGLGLLGYAIWSVW